MRKIKMTDEQHHKVIAIKRMFDDLFEDLEIDYYNSEVDMIVYNGLNDFFAANGMVWVGDDE